MTPDAPALRVAVFGHAQGRRGDGLSTYTRELVRALRSAGAAVHVVAHREDGDVLPVDAADATLLSSRRFKTVVVSRAGSMRTVRAALTAFAPDVVHISWSFSLSDSSIASLAHDLGAACVATFHLPHGTEASARGRVMRGLYRYHRLRMRDVDSCIALSDAQRSLLVRAGYPAERVTVIPNSVDTDAWSPGASRIRDELGARTLVVYLGRLDPEKRVPALVDSFLSLQLPGDHVLCIAGDGIQRERVERMAAHGTGVRVLGLVTAERALQLLRGADIVVLPSTAEGLALSLLEAMATGCAVVATDAGEDGRALGRSGIVIPVHPLRPALDDALRRLLADARLRARLGAAARERAVALFSARTATAHLLEVYDDARRRRAGARGTPAAAALP